MAIKFLPKIEVPSVVSIGIWEFYTFLKDSMDKVIDAFTQNDARWLRPNLINSWQNYGTPYQEASYRKDGSGMVWLSGAIKGGTPSATSIVFVLPIGYRPAATLRFPIASDNDSVGTFSINQHGHVVAEPSCSATLTIMDGIVFRVE
jgi:hypothetical protein